MKKLYFHVLDLCVSEKFYPGNLLWFKFTFKSPYTEYKPIPPCQPSDYTWHYTQEEFDLMCMQK
jgi:hypothetical protein